jgi:threonine/homoserine/homoserine lactone efflux protein
MSPFLQGILVGLTFAVLLGPAFFALIQTGIQRGFRSGFFLALGIFFSDLTALTLAYFGSVQFLGADPRENRLFSIIGGIILIIFGTFTFIRVVEDPKNTNENNSNNKTIKPYVFIIKGFLLNAANPGMWFIWITVVVSMSAKFGINNNSIYYFLCGVLGTIFGTDLVKCFVSHKIKQYINIHLMTWMNRIVGIILIGFGTYLIINTLVDMEMMLRLYREIFKKEPSSLLDSVLYQKLLWL